MRTAIVSNIHGNLNAFDAQLADLKAAGITRLVCLGDVAATGPQPRAVMERLRAINCPMVMGNADEWLLRPEPSATVNEDSRRFEAIDQWCLSQLRPADLDFLRTFRSTIEIGLGAVPALLLIMDHRIPIPSKSTPPYRMKPWKLPWQDRGRMCWRVLIGTFR